MLTLAIGIGACATAFTWINGILLQPLSGVADPMRLVTLESPDAQRRHGAQFVPGLPRLPRSSSRCRRGGASVPAAFSVGPEEPRGAHLGARWSAALNYFAVLGVQPEMGRMFQSAEVPDAPGKSPLAILSDRYWRSHYGSDPSIVGKT